MKCDRASSVRDVAVEAPGAIQVFERYRIVYCHRSDRSIADACSEVGMTPERLLADIERVVLDPYDPMDIDWRSRPLQEVIRHILTFHHGGARMRLSDLRRRTTDVAARHGRSFPELLVAKRVIDDVSRKLLPHMRREEEALFPYIVDIESSDAGDGQRQARRELIGEEIQTLSHEHDEEGALLGWLRSAMNDCEVEEDCEPDHEVLLSELRHFYDEMQRHVHLEDNILFPRAIELCREPEARAKGLVGRTPFAMGMQR